MSDHGGPGRDSSITPDKIRGRLAEALHEAVIRGETPSLREYAKRFGLGVAEVGKILEGVKAMAFAARTDAVVDEAAPAGPPPLPPDYEILGELGRGAMGVVYRARQRSMDRVVAVKVLRPGEALFVNLADRFRREVKALAKLRHPHIVAVHEVGEAGGHLFFAMDLVEGRSLHDLVQAGEVTPTRAVKLLTQVASAIAYTHSHGLVHRDLKPGNILVDERGAAFVVDFGLARDAAIECQLTGTGQILGTPAYMSPEQARGDTAAIGESTDVYAMGAVLYECLTRRPPFEGRGLLDLIRAVATEEPSAPRTIDPRIPRDLEVICLTAMAKEPQRRYPSAQAFQEDLERFVEGLPIRARPVSAPERLLRWAKRNPALAASAAGAFLSLAAGLAVTSWLLAETTRERNEKTVALDERDHALVAVASEVKEKERALADSERKSRLYRSSALAQTSASAETTDPMLALLLAREAVRTEPSPASVVRLRRALRASRERVVIAPADGAQVLSAELFADGSRLLVECGDATARVHDASGRELAELRHPRSPHGPAIATCAVSTDGARIAVGYVHDAAVRLWDAAGTPIGTLEPAVDPSPGGAAGCVRSVSFAPRGGRMLTCGDDGTVRVWGADLRPGAVIRPGDRTPPDAVFHADGERILTTDPLPVRLWDAAGNLLATFEGASHGGSASLQAAFSPDGTRVLAAFDDPRPPDERLAATIHGETIPSAKLWDLSGREVARFGRFPGALHVAMSRSVGSVWYLDGGERKWTHLEYVLVADSHRAHIFGSKGAELGMLPVAPSDLRDIAFAATGTEVIGTLDDGSARVWHLSNELELPAPPPNCVVRCDETACFRAAGGIRSARLTPDGARVVATGAGRCRVFDFQDYELACLKTASFRPVAFSPDGERFVVGRADGTAGVFDANGVTLFELRGHEMPLVTACFAPGADAILTASEDGTARLWTRDGAEAAVLRGHTAALRSAAFSADGSRVVTSSADATARLWTRDGKELAVLRGHTANVHTATFSPREDRVVTASDDGTVRVWTADGREAAVLRVGRPAWFAAILPSDEAVAVLLDDATYDESSGEGDGVTCSKFHRTRSGRPDVEVWGLDGVRRATFEAVTTIGSDRVAASVDLDEVARRRMDRTRWTDADERSLGALGPPDAAGQVGFAFSKADGTWRLCGALDDAGTSASRAAFEQIDAGTHDLVVLSRAGNRVLTVDGDLIRLWLVRAEDLLALAAQRCTRDFTAEERKEFADLLE